MYSPLFIIYQIQDFSFCNPAYHFLLLFLLLVFNSKWWPIRILSKEQVMLYSFYLYRIMILLCMSLTIHFLLCFFWFSTGINCVIYGLLHSAFGIFFLPLKSSYDPIWVFLTSNNCFLYVLHQEISALLIIFLTSVNRVLYSLDILSCFPVLVSLLA